MTMGNKNPTQLRKQSEAEYQQVVQKIADRVWEIWKEQLRRENERRTNGKRR